MLIYCHSKRYRLDQLEIVQYISDDNVTELSLAKSSSKVERLL